MKAEIITSTVLRDEHGLITKENVLIEWTSEKGFGLLYFNSLEDGKYEVNTEFMNFQHIVDVLKALK